MVTVAQPLNCPTLVGVSVQLPRLVIAFGAEGELAGASLLFPTRFAVVHDPIPDNQIVKFLHVYGLIVEGGSWRDVLKRKRSLGQA